MDHTSLRSARALALVAVLLLGGVAACGGDDGDDAAGDTTTTVATGGGSSDDDYGSGADDGGDDGSGSEEDGAVGCGRCALPSRRRDGGMTEHPAACPQWQEDLTGWLVAQLAPERELALDAHVVTCATCRTERDSLLGVAAVTLVGDPPTDVGCLAAPWT